MKYENIFIIFVDFSFLNLFKYFLINFKSKIRYTIIDSIFDSIQNLL